MVFISLGWINFIVITVFPKQLRLQKSDPLQTFNTDIHSPYNKNKNE